MSAGRPYILLIDHDAERGAALAAALGERGHRVRLARRLAGALRLLAEARPELLVVELDFWRRTAGWSVVRWLRSDPATASLPVIATTAPQPLPRALVDDLAWMQMTILQRPSADQLAAAIRALLGGGM